MEDDDFAKDMARPAATQFERLIGGIIEKAVRIKDAKTAEWILARTLGKMRERLEVSSQSLQVKVQATAALPTIEQLALENPDLSPTQLATFSDKLLKLKEEITASKNFAKQLLPAEGETIDVCISEDSGVQDAAQLDLPPPALRDEG